MPTSAYAIVLSPAAAKTYRQLESRDRQRIAAAVADLATNPRPPGAIKLRGVADLYRLRVGDWRIVYSPNDTAREVKVTKIGHRRDVYR